MRNGEILKKSRFNYSTKDNNGDLLLCNFAKGPSSFSKVKSKDIEKFESIISNSELNYNENEQHIKELFERGFLVAKSTDENITVNSLYYNAALNNRLMVIIMPTEQCNFRCPYCYETHKKGKMTKDNQKALLKYIQRKLSDTPKLLISWFGGEPLEAVDVIDYIMENVRDMCSKRDVAYSSDMTTNGYNLDASTFDRLYNYKIFRYQITIDGLKEQHNQQRYLADGGGTFEKIISNLLYIKNNKKYKFANITIRVNVSREILDKLDEFIKFYKENFGDDSRFSVAFTPVNDMGGETVKTVYNNFISTSELYDKFNELNLYSDKTLNLANIERAFTPTEALCYASKKNTYVIGSDLSIYKCTVHFDLEENIIGKIDESGKASINENYHNKWYINNSQKEMCKSCFLLPCCFGGGCPHKRAFYDETKNKCVLTQFKQEVKNALLYFPNKYEFKTISIKGEKNEKF